MSRNRHFEIGLRHLITDKIIHNPEYKDILQQLKRDPEFNEYLKTLEQVKKEPETKFLARQRLLKKRISRYIQKCYHKNLTKKIVINLIYMLTVNNNKDFEIRFYFNDWRRVYYKDPIIIKIFSYATMHSLPYFEIRFIDHKKQRHQLFSEDGNLFRNYLYYILHLYRHRLTLEFHSLGHFQHFPYLSYEYLTHNLFLIPDWHQQMETFQTISLGAVKREYPQLKDILQYLSNEKVFINDESQSSDYDSDY
jgi:hypothetical protein